MIVAICDGHKSPEKTSCGIVMWDRISGSSTRKTPTAEINITLDSSYTHNEAEWWALIYGLIECSKHGKDIFLYTDSQLVANQINGTYKTKNEKMVWLKNKFEKVVKETKSNVTVTWVPRQLTVLADEQAK